MLLHWMLLHTSWTTNKMHISAVFFSLATFYYCFWAQPFYGTTIGVWMGARVSFSCIPLFSSLCSQSDNSQYSANAKEFRLIFVYFGPLHSVSFALAHHRLRSKKKTECDILLDKRWRCDRPSKNRPPVYSYRICQNEWTLAVAILISPAIRYQLNRSFCNRRVCSALLSPCERVCYESGYMKPPPPPSPPLTFNSIHEKISYTSSLFLRR